MGPPGTVILTAAGDLTAALAAAAAGAALIDVWDAGGQVADAIRARHPAAATCARADWAGLTRDLATARRTGAVLICAGLAGATAAGEADLGQDRVLVEAGPAEATGLLADGWPVLVATDDAAGPHEAAAAGAMACWLGAAAIRTSHVTAARRAIEMTAAIKDGDGSTPAAP
jgi:hypothetical protein